MKHWRGKGFRLFTYLDDGAGADRDQGEVVRLSAEVRRDVLLSGFVREKRGVSGTQYNVVKFWAL